MKIDDRKDIFLQIIRNLFGDRTDEINSSNYLEFYHFLFSALEEEYKKEKKSSHKSKLILKIIGVLGNFDLMIDADPLMVEYFQTQSLLVEFLNNFANIPRKKYFEELFKIREFYVDVKSNFFK